MGGIGVVSSVMFVLVESSVRRGFPLLRMGNFRGFLVLRNQINASSSALSVRSDVDTILLIGSGHPEKLGRSLELETDQRGVTALIACAESLSGGGSRIH